eukprot:gnl/TRDRNA2_/TRDRNA2_77565_c0_seq2.p1 gnl/TRDRNA2_/TRDRNA2_77565_c0~~gnl/TRDRNA2_/TRDRNA2_77565_c0_seq2.p1  ORF type:complete len:270 (-),score=46.78 gnl/TRDRNA2_/TRDRNA2_77565_c0_seq2:108-917(-)
MNIVLEFVDDTLQRIIKHHRYKGKWMDLYDVRLYSYHLLRGLTSLGLKKIVHRDVKPSNLLIDSRSKMLKICDFGTAKHLDWPEEPSSPYLCSRYYRAPELILSSLEVSSAIDIWSAGCVFAEMVIGQPLFAGKNGVDQLAQIMEVLGTPSPADLCAMNPEFDATQDRFGTPVSAQSWELVLGRHVPAEATDFVALLLQYDPQARPYPLEALALSFFDVLRQDVAMRRKDPGLCTFSEEELRTLPVSLQEKLVPRELRGGFRDVVTIDG